MNAISVVRKGRSAHSGKSLIVGQRSWIAQHLFKELESRGRRPEYMMKVEVGDEPLDGATLYLIAGVARPTQDDMDREEDLCRRASRTGAKVVYLSSCAVDRWEAHSRVLSREGELYVLGKRRCETIVTGGPSGCGYALRAPVIFGPGQRLECRMLLMDIVNRTRDKMPIVLEQPFTPFEMVHVQDLCRAMVEVGEYGGSYPVFSLHGEPSITPIGLCALAAPGHPVLLKAGWAEHKASRTDDTEIYHVPRINAVFRPDDVLSTVAWYNDEVSQLDVPARTLLLEG